jgi:hypothetical protein
MLIMDEVDVPVRRSKNAPPLTGRAHHYVTKETQRGHVLIDGRGKKLGTFPTVRAARSYALHRFLPASGRCAGGYTFN